MGRPVLAAQQLRTPEERARSLDAALDRNMYSESGGITL
ncbi:recombinase RecA, partial [Burkholderia contaminans]